MIDYYPYILLTVLFCVYVLPGFYIVHTAQWCELHEEEEQILFINSPPYPPTYVMGPKAYQKFVFDTDSDEMRNPPTLDFMGCQIIQSLHVPTKKVFVGRVKVDRFGNKIDPIKVYKQKIPASPSVVMDKKTGDIQPHLPPLLTGHDLNATLAVIKSMFPDDAPGWTTFDEINTYP